MARKMYWTLSPQQGFTLSKLKMENLIVEPEIFTQGEATVICVPFFQDPNFTIDKLPAADINHHKGEKFNFKLNPKFNSGIVLQPSEAMDQDFKIPSWNQEVEKFVSDGLARDVARRVVLRKRFPLTVEVVDGVMYSKTQNVICESLGKIPYMKQQLITSQVFLTPPQPTTSQVFRTPETARVAVQQGFPNNSPSEEEDDFMMVGLGSMNTQGKPLTRFSLPNQQVAGPSGQMAQSPSPPKKRKWGAAAAASAPISHGALMSAVETIQQFFGGDIMDVFNIPFDRAGRNIPDVEPNPSSLNYSYSQFHENDELRQTNTTKMGSYLFGEDKKNCSLFIYKSKNKYTGHNVPFSIREGGSMITMIIATMIEAMEKVARNTLDNDKKEAAGMTGPAKHQAIRTSTEKFESKMSRLREDTPPGHE
ncbi:unnamed protein product [Orchesella dallaii]|uniref:Uncharacterized protein n=1 Tax=Orchesella dallaii TaxID=48710 RepID=A0ABP1RAM4_9HEXA